MQKIFQKLLEDGLVVVEKTKSGFRLTGKGPLGVVGLVIVLLIIARFADALARVFGI